MVVRELLTTLGFEVDDSKIKQYEQVINNVSSDLNKLIKDNTNSAKSFDTLDNSADSLNKELNQSVDNLEKVSNSTNEATEKTQKLSDSQDDLKESANRSTLSLSSLAKGFALLVTGATAAATAAFTLASSTARQSEEILKGARLAGTSVEEFQRLAYAAKTFGVEQDKLADILKDVNDKMGDYAQTGGGAMADFFEFIAPKVGVTAEQFKNLSGADALQLYVSSLEKANLSQADMTFYMEAIASDSTLLLPLLEKNGKAYKTLAKEAEEYGLILSEETIEQNKKFGQQLDKISNLFTGMKNLLSTKFIPVFSQVLTKIEEFIKKNWQLIRQNLEGFFEGAIWVVKQFINALGTLFGWIDKVAQLMGGWSNAIKIVGIAIAVLMALKFVPWIIAATAAIKALNVAMLLNPAGLMIAGIVALRTAIVLLIEDMYQWVQGNESVVGDLIATWFEFVTKIKGYLSEGVEYIKTKFGEISDEISNSFNTAIENVKGYFKGLFDDVLVFVDKIIGVFTSLKDKVSNIFGGVKDSINSGLKAVLPESVASAIGVDTNAEINQNILATPNITPTIPSVLGANGNSLSNVVNDNKTINITVPPGTTAEQVEAVKQQINKTMQQQYTDAAQHLEGY